MKAITIWQPWASLIVLGLKPYEFRGWPAPRALRGVPIGIHAGARPARKSEIADLILRLRGATPWTTCLRPEALPYLERWFSNPASLPLSAVIGTATLGKPVRASQIITEFGGGANDSDRDEHFNWAWPLTDPQPRETLDYVRGAQGFWDWRP